MTEQTEIYLQPDPDWDYYEVWNSLLSAKSQIDEALKLMKAEEHLNRDCDVAVHRYLAETVHILESIDLDVELDDDA